MHRIWVYGRVGRKRKSAHQTLRQKENGTQKHLCAKNLFPKLQGMQTLQFYADSVQYAAPQSVCFFLFFILSGAFWSRTGSEFPENVNVIHELH